ncbi:hypothetical protein HDC36_001205 [Xanthomonas sp. JAI131]|uniref:hypothetical protein n=1 Tax=Xanthomonas sp. JAI131 TaxID=2723067 RepID=UPI0015C9A43B|nr:hypothetical protein [Xanthomonas sp. JAI131]NYF19768.1 hypothetical protein [Xanthomonas sp. JAI131]
MSRPRSRRLQIEGAPFICGVRPLRDATAAALVLAAHGAGRHLRRCFRSDPAQGCLAGDAGLEAGTVRTAAGRWVSLHRPGVMRALIEAGLAHTAPAGHLDDGWQLLAAATLPADSLDHGREPG